MQKVIRDGKVAVLYSPGFGAGWYSWHLVLELVFHPEIVSLVEQNKRDDITEELICGLLNIPIEEAPYICGARDLTIKWLDEGTDFVIKEYDGSESILTQEDTLWLTA